LDAVRLDQLETYLSVVATGTTFGAAQALGISQSAVSRRIAQLESTLGIALFVRGRTRLVPTSEARLLEGRMRGVLERGTVLSARAKELADGNSAEVVLRVAFPSSLTLSVVPRIVARFLEAHDRVRIELHTGPYDTIERMLLDERAEIGFVRLPAQSAGLATRPLITASTVCVMPLDHPLARHASIAIRDLDGVPLVLLGRRRAARQPIDDAFAEAGVTPVVRVEAHSVCTACALVSTGVGVTLVNEVMARDTKHLPVAIRPLERRIDHEFAFAMAGHAEPGIAAERFMDMTADELERLLGDR